MGKSTDALASYFRPQAETLLERATADGLHPIVEDTDRTLDEQAVKITQGVSWTQHSKHLPQPPENKSEAIDVVPKECIALKYWGWNGKVENSHPHWGRLIAIGRSLGMRCGVDFPHPDPGHFEHKHPLVTA